MVFWQTPPRAVPVRCQDRASGRLAGATWLQAHRAKISEGSVWSEEPSSPRVRPHGLQPTRLLHPWDFPGKSTGVGCHCLRQCMKVESESEVAQSCPTLCDPMNRSTPGLPVKLLGPFGWTGLVSLQSTGLSRVFSNTTVQKHGTQALGQAGFSRCGMWVQ